MNRKLFYFVTAALVLFLIAGCNTVPKKVKEEMSGIKSKVDTLESRVEGVEAKQSDVERMASEQAQALEAMKEAKGKAPDTNISIKPRSGKASERVMDIQTCLKNAGFYNGKIDGIKGKMTRKAVKEFQKANGLRADGIVGPRTWGLLSKHESGAGAAPQTSGGTAENTK